MVTGVINMAISTISYNVLSVQNSKALAQEQKIKSDKENFIDLEEQVQNIHFAPKNSKNCVLIMAY